MMLSKLIEDALNDEKNEKLHDIWFDFHSDGRRYCLNRFEGVFDKVIYYFMYPNLFIKNLYKTLVLVKWKL